MANLPTVGFRCNSSKHGTGLRGLSRTDQDAQILTNATFQPVIFGLVADVFLHLLSSRGGRAGLSGASQETCDSGAQRDLKPYGVSRGCQSTDKGR
jgi:hypothetical protein